MRDVELLDQVLFKRRQWTEHYSVRDTLRLLTDGLARLGLQDWALKNDNSDDPIHPEIAVTGTYQMPAQRIREHFSALGLALNEKNESWERWVWKPRGIPGQKIEAIIQNYGPESYYTPTNTIILKASKYSETPEG
jgi:hypothetical protein